jgi:hypothetical protein
LNLKKYWRIRRRQGYGGQAGHLAAKNPLAGKNLPVF